MLKFEECWHNKMQTLLIYLCRGQDIIDCHVTWSKLVSWHEVPQGHNWLSRDLFYLVCCPICMIISLFSKKGVVLSHSGTILLCHSYVQVKYVMLNLIKFQQYFTLVSKCTKWNRSHHLTTFEYAPGEQSDM